MLKHCTPILLLAVVLLASCLPTPPLQSTTPTVLTSPSVTPLPTATSTLPSTSTVAPSPVEPTATSTVALPPENILKYQHIDITASLPSNARITDKLVLWAEGRAYLLNFPQLLREELLGKNLCLSTSPDGKWLAYCVSPDNSVDHWLVVESADGQQQKRLPMGKDWLYSITSNWLDNERLVFTLLRDLGEVWPVMVVNPFTGEQQELPSDYPDLWPSISGPAGTLHFLYTSVVYDPSLNLAIYPQTAKGGWFVVLWDRQAQKALASVKDLGEFQQVPLWAPNEKQFVIAVMEQVDQQTNEWIDEWFGVSQDGQVRQLTHFGDYFTYAHIGRANLSPDGRYLAFWLDSEPSQCDAGQQLAVLEMETQQVISYCLPNSVTPPVWSSNSRYIVVESYYEDNSSYVILIDIEQGWAAQIGENAAPVGWLVSSP